jgi:integrase
MATIRKRKCKWQVLIRRKGYSTISRSFFKRTDAVEWARYTEGQMDRGELPASSHTLEKYTVRDIVQRYLDEVTVKKLSRASESDLLRAFLRQPLADLSLAEVSAADFYAYREKRLLTVKPGTINRELFTIKHAFHIALEEWDVPLRVNPLAKVKKLKVQNARTRRLSTEEYETIKQAAQKTKNPYLLLVLRLAIETAMRRGELLNIHWKHIDWDARTLFIPVTKNGHSRTIPLTAEAIRILNEVKSLTGEGHKAFPISGDSTACAWDRLIKRTNIKDLHFHDLRHEAISRFFEKGLSVAEVALISGHRDFRMLFRYTHLKAEDLVKKFFN